MNTSELFFNTPVIDENGHVKTLSDFGGGGGGGFEVRKLEPNTDYILGNCVESGTINIYEIAPKVCLLCMDGVKLQLQSGTNTFIEFVNENVLYTNSGCVVGSTLYGAMSKNQFFAYSNNENILSITNSYSGSGTEFITAEKIILLD